MVSDALGANGCAHFGGAATSHSPAPPVARGQTSIALGPRCTATGRRQGLSWLKRAADTAKAPGTMTAAFPTYPDLRGKVALITGIGQVGIPDSSTWGNGAATARLLSYNGVKILGCDINLKAAEYTKQRILKDNDKAEIDVTTTDVTSTEDVQRFVQSAIDKHGRIDVLINNVGMTAKGDPGSMSEAAWMQQIDLNLHSVYRLCHAVLPTMEKQGSGTIINNASITALRYIGKPQIAYATAKAAVIQYTKAAGVMYAPKACG
ncbi:hypothetical protein LTR53_014516 [Teratosphaeriaceae sp. CCFEE 6253]|nr:hypothetical protein LTR53_014516 [Teratosphaeriaceae sp. CCFEE 6253]